LLLIGAAGAAVARDWVQCLLFAKVSRSELTLSPHGQLVSILYLIQVNDSYLRFGLVEIRVILRLSSVRLYGFMRIFIAWRGLGGGEGDLSSAMDVRIPFHVLRP